MYEEKDDLNKRKVDKITIIIGDFNIPPLVHIRTRRQKISKDEKDMNNTIQQLDLIDIYGTLLPSKCRIYIFFNTHKTFVMLDDILEQV